MKEVLLPQATQEMHCAVLGKWHCRKPLQNKKLSLHDMADCIVIEPQLTCFSISKALLL